MKRINIKDLARMLSVNASTVSRALAGHPDISESTKERVLKAAKELNYTPNLHAKFFRQKTSGLVAVILPEFNMFFIPEMMNAINQKLEEYGFTLIIFFTNNSHEKEIEIINHCLSWVVDGVLISVAENTKNLDHLQILRDAEIPVVLLDKVVENNVFPTVTIDDSTTSYNAVSHLIKSGHRHILGVFGHQGLQISKLRVEGFLRALKDQNIPHSQSDVLYKDKHFIKNFEKIVLKYKYDGAFFMSDELLSESYPILVKNKLYPEKMKIVSISDGSFPNKIYPQPDYFLHSAFELGSKAIESLIKYIKTHDKTIHHHKIETHLQTVKDQ
jgi:LacI family transcriptional regulator